MESRANYIEGRLVTLMRCGIGFLREEESALSISNVDAFPSEESCVDGPSSGSDENEGCNQGC